MITGGKVNDIGRRIWWKPIFSILLLTLVYYVVYHAAIGETTYTYDESDYMYAADQPFSTHYFDRGAIPFTDYLHLGMTKGFSKGNRTELSNAIRSSSDIDFYRHYHGPLYFYYLKLGEKIFGNREGTVRLFSHALQLFCSCGVLLCFWLLFGRKTSAGAALLASLLILLSPLNFSTGALITPQEMYNVWCLVSLFLMAIAINSGKIIYFYLSSFAIGLAFLSHEYAIQLPLCWLASVGIAYKKGKSAELKTVRFFAVALIIPMVTFLGLWPASLLKAALIKNYLFYLYTAIIRGDTIAHQSIAATWTIRVMASPIEYALSFLGFVFGMYVWCRRKQTIAAPFVMYLFLILLATMKMRVPMPTYTSSLTAVGLATAALSIIILCRDKKAWLGIGILFACCVALFAQLRFVYIPRQLEQLSASSKSAVISFIRNEHPRKLLVSRSMTPILHYYCREVKTDSYLPEFFAGGGEDEREIEEYLLNNSDYSGVLYSGTKIDFIRAEIAGRYASEEIPLSATADERCIYFRLVPKVQTVPHG